MENAIEFAREVLSHFVAILAAAFVLRHPPDENALQPPAAKPRNQSEQQ